MTIWKGTKISSGIVIGDDTQPWPSHYSILGAGGAMEVADIAGRNAIPSNTFLHPDGMGCGRRRNLMWVSVSDKGDGSNTVYQLIISGFNDLTDSDKLTALANNANWVEINFAPLDDFVTLNGTQTLTNKTLTSPIIINPIINAAVGSAETDAVGDMYYRDSAGEFTRLGIGTSGQFITSNGTLPQWSDASDTSWILSGNNLDSPSIIGSLNNVDWGLRRDNIEYITFTSIGPRFQNAFGQSDTGVFCYKQGSGRIVLSPDDGSTASGVIMSVYGMTGGDTISSAYLDNSFNIRSISSISSSTIDSLLIDGTGRVLLGTGTGISPGAKLDVLTFSNGSNLAFRIRNSSSIDVFKVTEAGSISITTGTSSQIATLSTSALAAPRTYTLPDATGIFVLNDNIATLTNKSGNISQWTNDSGYGYGLVPTAVKTSNYSAVIGDFVPCDNTSGTFTITLPSAPTDKKRIAVKLVIQGGTNTISIVTSGSDKFNKTGGSTTLTLTLLNQAINLQYNSSGSLWYVMDDDLTLSSLDARFVAPSLIGSQVLEADATNFITGATIPYFKNKDYVGKLFGWDFTNGITGWSSSGSGTIWALNGNYLQASVGGGATDFTNNYHYDSYPFVFTGQQAEIINFIPTVDATNTGEGIGIGLRTNDAVLDLVVRLDLSNSGTRGQLKIYQIVSGVATLLATSATNLSFTTNTDNLSLKIRHRNDNFIDVKVLNNTTSTSVSLIYSTAVISARPTKIAIYHFGGTVKIPIVNLKNISPKSKKTILIGDSITNVYAPLFLASTKYESYQESGSGGFSSDIVNALDSIINSGAANAIIMIGMNDAGGSVSSATYMINLTKIVEAVKEAGINPILCYVTPSTNGTRNGFIQSYNTNILAKWNTIYTIIDTYTPLSVDGTLTGALNPIYDSGDGIHPNSAGQIVLNNTICHATIASIPSNIPSLQEAQTFSGINTFSANNIFSGSNLFSLNNAFGNTSSISTNAVLNIIATNSNSATKYGVFSDFTANYTTTVSGSPASGFFRTILTGSQDFSTTSIYGLRALTTNNSASTGGNSLSIQTGILVDGANSSTGTSTAMRGIEINPFTNSGGGIVTAIQAITIDDQTVGTSNRGIRSLISAGASKHNLYISGTAQNYFAGNVGIGQITPTAYLHFAAGTAAAGTAPIQLTTGVNLTSPISGSIEYTTDDLFFTISTGTARKRILFADASSGLTSGRMPFVTTNGRLLDDTSLVYSTSTGLTTTKNITVPHLIGQTGIPTIAAGTGAGTSPTVSVGTGSTDLGGYVNITTGTLPTLSGTVATITFNTAYTAAPHCIIINAANGNAAVLSGANMVFVNQSGITTTTFDITAGTTALLGSTAYQFFYQVIQ